MKDKLGGGCKGVIAQLYDDVDIIEENQDENKRIKEEESKRVKEDKSKSSKEDKNKRAEDDKNKNSRFKRSYMLTEEQIERVYLLKVKNRQKDLSQLVGEAIDEYYKLFYKE